MNKRVIAVLVGTLLALMLATTWVPTVPQGTEHSWLPPHAWLRFRPVWTLDSPLRLPVDDLMAHPTQVGQIEHDQRPIGEYDGVDIPHVEFGVVEQRGEVTTLLLRGRVHWPTLIVEMVLLLGVGGLLALLFRTRAAREAA